MTVDSAGGIRMRTFLRVKPLSYIREIIFLFMIIISLSITLFIITMSYNKFESDSKKIREQYYSHHKKVIKSEVDNICQYMDYYINKSEETYKDNIKQQVYTLYDIINNHCRTNNLKSKQEIKKEVLDILNRVTPRPLTNYFAIELDEGKIIVPTKGSDKTTFGTLELIEYKEIEGIVDLVKKEGESYASLDGFILEAKGNENQSELSFIKYFEPLNMLIGSGINVKDLESEVKEELLDTIEDIKYDTDGYFYVTDYDGTALAFSDKSYIGKDITLIKDIKGTNVYQEIIDRVNEKGEGYFEYFWTKPYSKGVFSKLSYFKSYDKWEWIIGTGVYKDNIEANVVAIEVDLKKEMRDNLLSVLLVIGLLVFMLLLFQFYSTITELSVDGILIINSGGQVLDINKKGLELIGITRKEVNDTNIFQMFTDNIISKLDNRKHVYIDSILENKKGKKIPVEIHIKLTKIRRREYYIAYLRDLTKRINYEKKLEKLALVDELTGVYNRRFLISQIKSDVKNHRKKDKPISLAMIDVDLFKSINDTYGHTYGDEILKYFADTFKQNIRDMDYIGRYGGEEFIIIFPETDKDSAYASLDRIKNIIKNHSFKEKELKLTFSAGIVEIDTNNSQLNIAEYIKKVDRLLYKAKGNGRDRIEI